VSQSRKIRSALRPIRAKLIFNPGAGRPEESPQQLATILSEMQDREILTEVYTLRPDSRLETVVRDAIKSGIKLIVVAGGDGTIDSVAAAMIGSGATLGILPTGTRNNVAFSLGIPTEIPASVALLRTGEHLRMDMGQIRQGRSRHWFLELAALGLLTDLYPLADNIQHGDLTVIGELLSTLVSATPSRMQISMDGRKPIVTEAHMMLITNIPYLGPNLQISQETSFKDGRLDIFTFSDTSKLQLISSAMLSQVGFVEDNGIKHFRVKHMKVQTIPRMPVLADGIKLGEGSFSVQIHPRALRVMAGAVSGRKASISVLKDSKEADHGREG
jgi:diacylglycerol kinase (ATP)